MATETLDYKKMWEDIGEDAGRGYLAIKFKPTYRIGLTNFVREEAIYQYLDPKPTDKVLDVGCASGRQIFRIIDRVAEGHGVDIAESFIAAANSFKDEKGITNAFFKVAVIEALPYSDQYFDKVICGEVLEHVFDKDLALAELSRVLKSGGTLIITVPNLNADGTWWGRLLRFLKIRSFVPMEKFSQQELRKHGDSHVREFSAKTMRFWLENRGWKVENITTASFVDGPWVDWLLKVPLHTPPLRWLIIKFEQALTGLNLKWGRHLVVKAKKI